MSKYLMTLTPREPYFFGNEKSFKYPGSTVGDESNRYYIKSELVPAQTTLIGTLRYILLPIKKEYGKYNDTDLKANAAAVGEKSFIYGAENEFGKILGISPIFILKGDEKLVVTPFDHSIGGTKITERLPDGTEVEKELYTPFSKYTDPCGERIYPTEYNVKQGISHSYVSLVDKKIYEHYDIFKTDVRIGINLSAEDKGFFKKEYVAMLPDFAFGAYVTLDDGIAPIDSIVYMGQGKSLFTVTFKKVSDNADKDFVDEVAKILRDDVIYCLSDMFVQSDIYKETMFAVTDTKDYRAYTTNGGKISKSSKLYKLVKAGSILIPKAESSLKTKIKNKSVEIIGYNKVVTKLEDFK